MTQAYNLAQLANNVNSSGQLNAATALNGITPVANGGSGLSTITANNVILGNGTSAVQVVAPGTSGNILTSNGTTWTSIAAPTSGFTNIAVYTSSGTFNATALGVTKAKITVVAGGGGVNGSTGGGSSSFGAICSATGNGGIGTGGDLNIAGSLSGSGGLINQNGPLPAGGSSIFGGGGAGNSNGRAYGGGAGGYQSSTPVCGGGYNYFANSGGGGGGAAIKYASSLSGTYSVTVASPGTGTWAGAGGVVIVEY